MKRFASVIGEYAPILARDLVGLAGFSAIIRGAWLIDHAAGFVVGGLIGVGLSYLLARRG